MNRLKAVEELGEKWVRENSLTAGVIGNPVGEVKAFVGGFITAMDLAKDAWDAGYEAGKAYGLGLVEAKEDA
jgi:hypothetical protein